TALDPPVGETTEATISGRMLDNSRRLRAGIHRGPLAGLPTTEAALRHAWEHQWSLDRKREIIAEGVKLPPEGQGITRVPVGRGRRAGPDDLRVDLRLSPTATSSARRPPSIHIWSRSSST